VRLVEFVTESAIHVECLLNVCLGLIVLSDYRAELTTLTV
jgi:hypothetical protein